MAHCQIQKGPQGVERGQHLGGCKNKCGAETSCRKRAMFFRCGQRENSARRLRGGPLVDAEMLFDRGDTLECVVYLFAVAAMVFHRGFHVL
jgi:hypothetical protein